MCRIYKYMQKKCITKKLFAKNAVNLTPEDLMFRFEEACAGCSFIWKLKQKRNREYLKLCDNE